MATPTRYREIEIGDGNYAAVENNKRNAQRGTFVVEGGRVTPGTSTSDVTLNAEATEFRADGADYNLNTGQPAVTLPANTTPYPRRDLVVAKVPQSDTGTASYDTIEGEPIDSETMQSLIADGKIDDNGIPIYPVMAIPEVQPPPGQGLLNQATVLAMVYTPPNTQDATDLTDQYITDLRLSGIGVDDVLRSGGAITEVESKDGTLDVTATDSEAVGGVSYQELQKRRPNIYATGRDITNGSQTYVNIPVPDGMTMEVWGMGISTNQAKSDEGSVAARLSSQLGSSGLVRRVEAMWRSSAGETPLNTVEGPASLYLLALNSTGRTVDHIRASMSYTFVDT